MIREPPVLYQNPVYQNNLTGVIVHPLVTGFGMHPWAVSLKPDG